MRRRRRGTDQRGNLYLLTGLVIGLVLGLAYAWVVSPVKYVDIEPSALTSAGKDEYRQVIADAYAVDGDLERASARLALMDGSSSVSILAAQAQRLLAENKSPQDARALAVLAADLGRTSDEQSNETAVAAQASGEPTQTQAADSAPEVSVTATLEVAAIQTPTLAKPTITPTVTRTPVPTFTPRPTATPLRLLDGPFSLAERKEICDGSASPGMLLIEVKDSNGQPLAGVPIIASWPGGEDTFYTGLNPQVSPGYADFQMEKGISYSIKVSQASEPLNGIGIPGCGGSWYLLFQE